MSDIWDGRHRLPWIICHQSHEVCETSGEGDAGVLGQSTLFRLNFYDWKWSSCFKRLLGNLSVY